MQGLAPHDRKSQQQLQREAFERLGDVPSVLEWLASIHNKHTRRAYLKDIQQFQQFSGITDS